MTKKKRTASNRKDVYGGSEAGSPPPIICLETALRGGDGTHARRRLRASFRVGEQQVAASLGPLPRDEARELWGGSAR